MTGCRITALAAALSTAAAAGAAVAPPVSAQEKVRVQSPRALEIFAGGSRIGVSVRDLDDADMKSRPGAAGVVVEEVATGSPAEKGGIRKGDVIVEFDGERVRSARQLTRLVQETPAGRSVTAAILRDGQRSTVTVTPSESSTFSFGDLPELEGWARDFAYSVVPRPPSPPSRPMPPSAPGVRRFDELIGRASRLGVTVDSLSPQLAEYFGTKQGVLVTSVYDDSAAAKAGLKAGDVITSLNGSPVDQTSDVRRMIQELQEGDEFTLQVMRDRKPLTLKGKVENSERRRTVRTML